MSEHAGGTVRYYRADWRPVTDEPWLVWFTKDQADPYWFTAEQGEAMGLTPPEPAPLVVTCNGHSVELSGDDVAAHVDTYSTIESVSGKLARLLRDARQDPQSDPIELRFSDVAESDEQPWPQPTVGIPSDDSASDDIDFDALPIGTVAEVTLLDGDRLLALKQDDEPGRNWFIGDCSDVDITKLRDVLVVYQPAPLSPGECLRGLLAGRDDADQLRREAAQWNPDGNSAWSRMVRLVGDAAREVHG